jgi:glutamine amidotransferase
MCRFLVFASKNPALLGDVVLFPSHSIMKQSYACVERKVSDEVPASINADGFGIGWYSSSPASSSSSNKQQEQKQQQQPNAADHHHHHHHHHHKSSKSKKAAETAAQRESKVRALAPCLFTSTLPAWNNKNLWRLSEKVAAPLIFAHVRAATMGSCVADFNCHPFSFGRFLWMHNGGIAQFSRIKRGLVRCLDDEVYRSIGGTTDSETAFAVFLHELGAANRAASLEKPLAPKVMQDAMLRAVTRILQHLRKERVMAHSLLNFAVSDGVTVVTTCFIDDVNPAKCPASLYFAAGTSFAPADGADGEYRMNQVDRREEVVIVASERLTSVAEDWVSVARNRMLVINANRIVLLFKMDIAPALMLDSSSSSSKSAADAASTASACTTPACAAAAAVDATAAATSAV